MHSLLATSDDEAQAKMKAMSGACFIGEMKAEDAHAAVDSNMPQG